MAKLKGKRTPVLPRAAGAFLVFPDAQSMSKARRMDIAKWLLLQAEALVAEGDLYGKRFKASYLLPDGH